MEVKPPPTPRERLEAIAKKVSLENEQPRRIINSRYTDAKAVRTRHQAYVEMFDAGFSITQIARFCNKSYGGVRTVILLELAARRAKRK